MMDWDDLKAKYPRLIPERFGFQCDFGWLSILDRYFAVVDHHTAVRIPDPIDAFRFSLVSL